MNTTDNQYGSRLGAILTMIGVAVGLGNVWRFPYMMGAYGGSAFLLIYLLFTLALAFPALLTEMLAGRNSGSSTLTAYANLFGNRWGKAIGYLLILAVTVAGSYYVVVVANVFFSAGFSIIRGFSADHNPGYHALLADSALQYGVVVLTVVAALYVAHRGLKKGIERISRIIMPFFLLAVLYMIVYAWTLPGALAKVRQFLAPDFSAVGPREVFAALGQAFYSIGLGGTFVVVYASYIGESRDIPRIGVFTCLGDLGASLLVSLFLVPATLVMGMQMDAGPSLIFQTLPELFAVLPGGRLIGSLFLLSVSLVAFLSLIAAFQVPISSLAGHRISGKKLLTGFGLLQLLLSFPSTFYPQLIGLLDLVFGSGMQVLGSMLAVMGMWWGARRLFFRKMLFADPESGRAGLAVFWLRWIVPGTLLAVLIGYVYSSLSGG
ncbi:MAG: sodium-dependent transporter [Lewinellaceae bacterium]|nr:sodium-dependent transporter [Lewinellaceae bacterium]